MENVGNLGVNLQAAARYIELLSGCKNGFEQPEQFQTFTDSKNVDKTNWKKDSRGQPLDPYARVYYDTLQELAPEFIRLNKLGVGIFMTVNECKGTKRGNAFVTRVRALFLDGDEDKFTGELRLEPSFTVRRGKNFHHYWLVKDFPLNEFKAQQLAIAKAHNTDHIIDLARVMRVPGFYHQKNAPELVTL